MSMLEQHTGLEPSTICLCTPNVFERAIQEAMTYLDVLLEESVHGDGCGALAVYQQELGHCPAGSVGSEDAGPGRHDGYDHDLV